MQKARYYTVLRQVCTVVAIGVLVALGGCGGQEEDLCAEVTCDFGSCDSSSGYCVNPDSCEVDLNCIPGFECGPEYTCVANDTCTSDADCQPGVCRDGACVNPSSCASNDECLERTYCATDDTCRPDPCNRISCQRGVCERGTDNCVSAPSCTTESESVDCIDGEKCARGTCKPAGTFCEDFECERGVCSFQEAGCVAAENCEGDDQKCLDGQFCNDQSQCRTSLCVENQVDCTGNGVCQPATGECENAETCESTADCVEDHLCVEGTCRLESLACGDADGDGGCPGNRICEYTEETLGAECLEAEFCETSIDCDDGRQCGGQACLDFINCRDDIFEPNNTVDAAIDFLSVTSDKSVSASLCEGDTDHFAFNSAELIDGLYRGALLVEVNAARHDIGLGSLELAVVDSDGTELTASTGADGKARIEHGLIIPSHGDFTVEVRAADELTRAGMSYDLSINFLPDEAVDVCNTAEALEAGRTVTGDTEKSDSRALGSSCTSPTNVSLDSVYSLTLDTAQKVTAILDPADSSTHVTMSVRGLCAHPATEKACASEAEAGRRQVMNTVLEAGTYYFIVQAPTDGGGGEFELTVNTSDVSCAGDYCSDAGTANLCNATGSNFTSVDCDMGCDPSRGRCFAPDGDVCASAPLISADTSLTIDLSQLRNEYSVAADGCIDADPTRTDGPEQTYEVEIPAQTALTAELEFADQVAGSLYLLEDCTDVDGTCVDGASGSVSGNATQEALTYTNFGDQPMTVFLVVDTAAGQAVSEAYLDVSFIDVVCEPGANRCEPSGASRSQVCGPHGIEWLDNQDCGDWPCGGEGVCLIPEDCSSALDVTAQAARDGGVTFSDLTWGDYRNDMGGDGCGLTSGLTDAHDVVFEVSLQADEAVRATLDSLNSSPLSDPAIYILPGCGNLDSACLDGAYSSGDPVVVTHATDTPQTVYVVADSDDTSSSEKFEVNIEILPACDSNNSSPSCQSGDVEYCDPPGLTATYSCGGGGCTAGACDVKSGDYCFDAEDITAAASASGGTSIQVDWSQYSNYVYEDATCGMQNSDIDGTDAFFRVDLKAGESLVASLDQNASSDDPALIVTGDCLSPGSSCLAADADTSVASVTYFAQVDETVYLIADSDDANVSANTFTLDVQVGVPECNPATYSPTCSSGADLQYCNESGFYATHTCSSNSCSGSSCDSPDGDLCWEAIDATSAANQAGGVTYSSTWSSHANDYQEYCGISSGYSDGEDVVYAVSLLANETLTASVSTSNTTWAAVAIASDCRLNSTSCLTSHSPSSTSASAQYTASSDETVYVVFDNDNWSDAPFDVTLEVQ